MYPRSVVASFVNCVPGLKSTSPHLDARTPEGVAAFTGGPYLKDGDVIEGTVERIGTLRNPVRAE
jgi:hypothetical protein